jgi:hypothetical protein
MIYTDHSILIYVSLRVKEQSFIETISMQCCSLWNSSAQLILSVDGAQVTIPFQRISHSPANKLGYQGGGPDGLLCEYQCKVQKDGH